MKLRDLLAGVPLTGGNADLNMEINSISYDTRTLEPGALFAALPGARDDGARYIREALDRGAAAVLCRERPEEDGPWLVTPDPRRALALLSANWFGRPAEGLTLVGVTGTNGKTTTTYLLDHLFASAGKKTGVLGTVSYRWPGHHEDAPMTTPDCLDVHTMLADMRAAGVDMAFMEVSSHALDQNRVAGVGFGGAVFSNLMGTANLSRIA